MNLPHDMLLHQVHPNWVKGSKILSPGFAFRGGEMSIDDGTLITPQDAHAHYTQTIGADSEGTWGITVEEVTAGGMTAVPSPYPERNCAKTGKALPAWPSHGDVLCGAIDPRAAAKILAAKAEQRGALFRP